MSRRLGGCIAPLAVDERIAVLQEQLVTQQGQINALQKEAARIDTLAARLSALEEQARTDRAERLAAATH